MKSDWISESSRMFSLLSACLSLSCTIACGQQATQPTPPGSATVRITGTVVEIGGGPVAEATVKAFRCSSRDASLAQTLTDTIGGFNLTFDAAMSTMGCVFLRVQKAGYANESAQLEKLEGIIINLQRERRVSGTIVEVDGGPVYGVRISTAGSSPVSTAFSDANGSFVIAGVSKFMNLVNSRSPDPERLRLRDKIMSA